MSVAVGYTALGSQNMTTATNALNVGVGQAAGSAITTGTNNVSVGGLAADALTEGANNIAIGTQA